MRVGVPLWVTENSHVLAFFREEKNAAWGTPLGGLRVVDGLGATVWMGMAGSSAGSRWEHP